MTPAEAVTAIVETIEAAGLTRGDQEKLSVVPYPPQPGTLDRPASVSVTFAGMTAIDWRITVTLFLDTSSDVPAAETLAQTLTPQVDAALDELPIPRSDWTKAWSEQLNAFAVETTVDFPREDF